MTLSADAAILLHYRQAAKEAGESGAYADAIQLLENIISSPLATSTDWLNYCSYMILGGDTTTALSLIDALARQMHEDSFLQVNRGILHFNAGNYGAAAEYLIRVLDEGHVTGSVALSCLSSAIICHIYGPFDDPDLLSQLVQRWHHEFIRSIPAETPRPRRHLNDKLRICYVNNYFSNSVYYTLTFGLIGNHNCDHFDIYCYDFSETQKNPPPKLPNGFIFRSLGHLSNDEILNTIEDDKIDIFIDMNGFDTSNKWEVYARNQSPIKASWYNVFSPMGGRMFDYIIMDETLCPPSLHHNFKEDIALLPCWTIMVPPEGAPAVSPLPALSTGHITFGSFNRPLKLNERVFAVWKRILDAVPGSRLSLRNGGFSTPFNCDRILDLALDVGISRDQIDIHGWSDRGEFLAAYDHIDIQLDPFPFNGGITSLEGMWQGVPMVVLNGNSWGGRLGAMLLTGANKLEWLAQTEDEYVALAVKLASDLTGLNQIRQGLRDHLSASTIMDGKRAALAMESLFLTMADRYRAEQG